MEKVSNAKLPNMASAGAKEAQGTATDLPADTDNAELASSGATAPDNTKTSGIAAKVNQIK